MEETNQHVIQHGPHFSSRVTACFIGMCPRSRLHAVLGRSDCGTVALLAVVRRLMGCGAAVAWSGCLHWNEWPVGVWLDSPWLEARNDREDRPYWNSCE